MTSAPVPESRSDSPPPPGRPITLVPLPRGSWRLLLGAGLALLGPLFGFLIGSSMGPGDRTADMSPLQLALFVGFAIGGLGILVALTGARRLYLDRRAGDSSSPG